MIERSSSDGKKQFFWWQELSLLKAAEQEDPILQISTILIKNQLSQKSIKSYYIGKDVASD